MNKLATVLVAAVCAGAAHAQSMSADHLWPEQSYFEIAPYAGTTKSPTQRHYDLLMAVLELAFREPNTRMRMIEMPLSGPDSATGIRTNADGKLAIFSVKSELDLEKLVTSSGPTPDPHDVKVDRCEIPIDPALAKKITNVWWAMLLRTRYYQPNEESIFEGEGEYHFYAEQAFGDFGRELEGWTWAVKPETKVGALIGIVADMRQYCIIKDSASLLKLKADEGILSNELNIASP
ncbi:MAG: hypothetical protein WCA81_06845 [Rhizomicrobium sp.]